MRLVALFLGVGVAACVGCGKPGAQTPDKVREFKEKLGNYLVEVRAGTKLLALPPSLAQATAKCEQLEDLYAHLPDVPRGIAGTEYLDKDLKRINTKFRLVCDYLKMRIEVQELAEKSDYEEEIKKKYDLYIEDLKKAANDIDKLVGL